MVPPASIVTASVIVDFIRVVDWIKPKYGDKLCWITQKYGLIIFFVVPIAVAIVINAIFFALTSCSIRKTVASTRGDLGKNTNGEALEYIRLFVPMGTTWIFGFIASLSGIDAFWYIFIVLNASQGFLIVMSSICTKEIKKQVTRWKRKTFSGKPRDASSPSAPETSGTTL